MKLPFEDYQPATPPERMLAAIRGEAGRRRRRRRISAGVAATAALAGIGWLALTDRTPIPAPSAESGSVTVIRSVERAGKPVPYTLVTLPGGQVCIVVRSVAP